jgi:hypothetical protein
MKTAITINIRWCIRVCSRLQMVCANGLQRRSKQAEAKVPAISVCRRIDDHPCTAIPIHAALMRRPALSMASAAHVFSQSSVGLMASAPMIREGRQVVRRQQSPSGREPFGRLSRCECQLSEDDLASIVQSPGGGCFHHAEAVAAEPPANTCESPAAQIRWRRRPRSCGGLRKAQNPMKGSL